MKRYMIYLALASLIFIIPGCGGGNSAPEDAVITINPTETKVSDGTLSVDTSTTFFHISVKDANGIPYNDVDLTISYIWADPNINDLVQLYDGSTPVDSPMTAKTDSDGSYILRFDFKSGGGLEYSADLHVSSGAVSETATFEVDAGE